MVTASHLAFRDAAHPEIGILIGTIVAMRMTKNLQMTTVQRDGGKVRGRCYATFLALLCFPFTASFAEEIASPTSATVCHKVADRYRGLAHANHGKGPLEVLASVPNSGITLMSTSTPFAHPEKDLLSWATTQTPALKISDSLKKSVQAFEAIGGGGDLQKAPGIDFYTISRVSGSQGCSETLTFQVHDGVALKVKGPAGTEEDLANSCGRAVVFGAVDGTPVIFDQHYDWAPGMSASIDISVWDKDDFADACTVVLTYKPDFTRRTFNDPDGKCEDRGCEKFRAAATKMVEEALGDEHSMQSRLRRGLTRVQQDQYAVAERVATAHPPEDSELFVPYERAGEIYLVSLGHQTVGWRVYADWSVKFETLKGDHLVEVADLPVGVWKGDIESTEVAP